MNTSKLYILLIVLVTLTSCASPGSTQVPPASVKAEYEQETFELGSFGMVAVQAGILEAGNYYFVPSATAVSGGISVYSLTQGTVIGFLIERLVEVGPGIIQDMVEGPRTFYWDGQITTINRATGEIRVYALEDADTAEAENAKTDEEAQAKAGEEEKVSQYQSDPIIHVDDDPTWIRIGAEIIGPTMVFNDCESLISALQANPALHGRAYIVDNDLGPGKMKGPQCVQQILALRPGSVIIGLSGGFNDPGFVNSGAKTWVSKTKVDFKTFRDLLP